MLLVPAVAASDPDLNNGLISRWTGDGTANDAIGPNNGAQVGHGVYVDGKFNQAFYFNGNDDYVLVPYNDDYNFATTDSFTISAWVKPDEYDPGRSYAILVKSPANDVWDWGLFLYDGFMTGRHNVNILHSKTPVEAGKWYLATATYNGSSGSLKLYVDGALEGETNGFAITASRGGIGIGVKGEAVGMDRFKGAVDDVRLYGRDLSAAEVADLYGQPPEADLVAKAALPVAAVAVGSGLGILGLFLGRVNDFLSSVFGKMTAWLKDLWALFNKIVPIDTLFDFVQGYVKSHLKSLLFREASKLEKSTARSHVSFLAGFSAQELAVILITSAFLGVAFLISKKMDLLQPGMLALYIVVAGFAIILHDLTHRYTAWRYNVVTEYKFWGFGTVIMFFTSLLFGIVYAMPARTVMNDAGRLTPWQKAVVFGSGPLVSLLVAAVFLLLVPLGGPARAVGLLGGSMNMLSAVYGLMPFDPMDGNKVLKWKTLAWVAIFAPLLLLYLGLTIYLF